MKKEKRNFYALRDAEDVGDQQATFLMGKKRKNTIENDHATPCTFYSTEMTNSQLMARMMANKEHEKSKLWEFIFLFCINVG